MPAIICCGAAKGEAVLANGGDGSSDPIVAVVDAVEGGRGWGGRRGRWWLGAGGKGGRARGGGAGGRGRGRWWRWEGRFGRG